MTGVRIAPDAGPLAAGGHALRRAAWLADGVLLLLATPLRPAPGGAAAQVESAAFAAPAGTVFAAAAPAGLLERPGPLRFADPATGATLLAEADDVADVVTDLRTLLREGPAGWDAAARTALLAFLAGLGARHGLAADLAEGLHDAREALRERRPVSVEDPRAPRTLRVEQLLAIDETAFYLRATAWDADGALDGVAAVSPEGERVELSERAWRHGDQLVALFETRAPSRRGAGWVVEAAAGPGREVEAGAEAVPATLDALAADAGAVGELLDRHAAPAIERLLAGRAAAARLCELTTYGDVPAAPEVSLIVPVNRRVDLIEHQLAQFARDPAIRECELLYVLDDAEQARLLREVAAGLHALYGLPFRTAVATGGAGQATCVNLGAEVARGRRLLLLEAGVLPERPGWVAALAAAGGAAAGPKLVYEDAAIASAGVELGAAGGLAHRFRGLHRAFPAAQAPARVPALATAALMVDAEAFRAAGGLSAGYVDAGCEGPDLCLRLAGDCRYVPAAELVHLDALDPPSRPDAPLYDRRRLGRRL